MSRTRSGSWVGWFLVCVAVAVPAGWGGVARGQDAPAPTFSLEAVAVGGSMLPEPMSSIRVGPGERILAKIFLRDWSVHGEILRAYQAELDPATFESGDTGAIRPVNYVELREKREENPAAAYIDDKDPQYVHTGLHIIPIVDTIKAPGYRWLTVLLEPDQGPVSQQDGTRYYLGTVELEASADASGEFTVGFAENRDQTGLLDLNSEHIPGIRYEGLHVTVDPNFIRLIIRESEPSNEAIDARLADARGLGSAAAWNAVGIRFNLDATQVSQSDFVVTDCTATPPTVRDMSVDGPNVSLTLSSTITPGCWTDITYQPTGSCVRLGYLPGDVTNDGRTNSADLIALVEVLNGTKSLPAFRTDLDRSGETTSADLASLVNFMSGLRTRGGARLASR